LLRKEGVTEIRCPLDIASHTLNHVRVSGQGLNAWVPRLLGHGIGQRLVFQIFISIHPLLKLNDLQWVSGGGEGLGQQRIGIQRDRRNQ
jgi:hypothetical protein